MKNSKLVFGFACLTGLLLLAHPGLLLAEEAQNSEPQAPASVAIEETEPAAAQPKTDLTAEDKTKIVEAAKRSVEDEIKVFGSFEIDHPETDELMKLTLSQTGQEVKVQADGTYVVQADFKDEKGTSYSVDLYLEAVEGDYELADAILVSAAGKPVGEGKTAS